MFQKLTGQVAAIIATLCLTMTPMASFADGPKVPAKQTMLSQVKDFSLADIRLETKSKVSETRQWVADTKVEQNFEYLMNDLSKATDNLQDQVAPAGYSLKSFISKKMPGKNLVAAGDRTVTVFGLLLILAFATVVFCMSLANPASRLGGRH